MTDEKEILEDAVKEELPKKTKNIYSEKSCKIISYIESLGILDVDFDGYGIRITNAKNISGDSVKVKYKGIIGSTDFTYKL